MPTYQYACTVASCGHQFDAVQPFSDNALTECPECSGRLRKVWGSIGVMFKGSGFYRNDSREGTKNGERKTDAKDSAESTSSTNAKSDNAASSTSTGSTGDSGSATKPAAAKAASSKAAASKTEGSRSRGDSRSGTKRNPAAATS